MIQMLEDYGATIKVISIPLVKYTLPYYYSLLPSEAASNMARYDGIRYGYQPEIFENTHNKSAADPQSDLFSYIAKAKTAAFGINVKRRVVLGNFLMSSGEGLQDFNQHLVNAQKFRRMLTQQYFDVLKEHNVDFVISPTGFGELPPKISDIQKPDPASKKGERKSPVFEYKMDFFTVIANSIGTCNMTVPLFESEQARTKYLGFPTSIRLMGFFGEDFHLLRTGQKLEKILEINGMSAK